MNRIVVVGLFDAVEPAASAACALRALPLPEGDITTLSAVALAMFLLLYMIFAKLFPIMAISDVQEHLFHTTDRKIGEASVASIAMPHDTGKGGHG